MAKHKSQDGTDLLTITEGETLLNPTSVIRTLIDHSAAGGPVLDITEALKNTPLEETRGSGQTVFVIDHQPRIECSRSKGFVRVWQEGQHGEGDNVQIEVALSNVISLVRCILWAAGFKDPIIAEYEKGGGYSDLEDGAISDEALDEKKNA